MRQRPGANSKLDAMLDDAQGLLDEQEQADVIYELETQQIQQARLWQVRGLGTLPDRIACTLRSSVVRTLCCAARQANARVRSTQIQFSSTTVWMPSPPELRAYDTVLVLQTVFGIGAAALSAFFLYATADQLMSPWEKVSLYDCLCSCSCCRSYLPHSIIMPQLPIGARACHVLHLLVPRG